MNISIYMIGRGAVKELTVYTDCYLKELSETVHHEIHGNGFVKLYLDNENTQKLIELMKNIVIKENIIVKNNAKLFSAVQRVVSKISGAQTENEITEFINKNDTINLEGYIKFRMVEYSYAVNIALYTIVKELNQR